MRDTFASSSTQLLIFLINTYAFIYFGGLVGKEHVDVLPHIRP